MRIFNVSTLRKFWEKHPDSELSLRFWVQKTQKSEWSNPHEIKSDYAASVDFVGKNRAIFNIKGNHYRLIIKVYYIRKFCYVMFIGTHNEYDKIDASTVNNYGK